MQFGQVRVPTVELALLIGTQGDSRLLGPPRADLLLMEESPPQIDPKSSKKGPFKGVGPGKGVPTKGSVELIAPCAKGDDQPDGQGQMQFEGGGSVEPLW
jgi:hypothetical protein